MGNELSLAVASDAAKAIAESAAKWKAIREDIKESLKNDKTFRTMQKIERLGVVWDLKVGLPAAGMKGPDGGEPITEYFAEIRMGQFEGLAARAYYPHEALEQLLALIDAKKKEEIPAYAR